MGLWSKITGAGKKAAMAPVGSAKKLIGYDEALANAGWIGGLFKGLMPSSIRAGRIETFDHAMARLKVTSENQSRIYTNYVFRFWIFSAFSVIGLALGARYALAGSLISFLPVAGFEAVCLSQIFVGSFRAYQIANRRFCDVSEWLGRAGSWVPQGFSLPPAPQPKRGGTGLVAAPPSKPAGKPAGAKPPEKRG